MTNPFIEQPTPESKVERQLRRMLCAAICGATAYMDDGEASDCSVSPSIDFLRMTPEQIQSALSARGLRKLLRYQDPDSNTLSINSQKQSGAFLSDVTAAQMMLAHQLEKMLCEALGRPWSVLDSCESLVRELAKKRDSEYKSETALKQYIWEVLGRGDLEQPDTVNVKELIDELARQRYTRPGA